MKKYFFMTILTIVLLFSFQASADTMMNKNMDKTTTTQDQNMMKQCKDMQTGKWMWDKQECAQYKMMKGQMMMYGKYGYGMHGMYSGKYVCAISIALTWTLMFLGIIALWTWIKKQK
jgi:hypothetical protein